MVLIGGVAHAAQPETNLLTNGSFEFWSRYHPEHFKAMSKDNPPADTGKLLKKLFGNKP